MTSRKNRKKWSDLSPGAQRLIIAMAAAEGALKLAALADLKRRPASQIRGPKWAWAPAITVVNLAGGESLLYFLCGRRRGGNAS